MWSPLNGAGQNKDGLKESVITAIEQRYYKELNRTELEKISLSEIIELLDKDSSLVEGQTPDLDYLRGFKNKPTVTAPQMVSSSAGYIVVHSFAKTTPRELKKALKELKSRGADRIIIDLRGNSGGDFQAAISSLRLFLPKGKEIATLLKRKSGEVYRSRNSEFYDFSGVVLVDSRTASSAELVAETLRNIKGYQVIGTETQGKRTVQELIPVRNKWLALTIGTWHAGQGNMNGRNGKVEDPRPLVPDFEIRDPLEQLKKASDVLSH